METKTYFPRTGTKPWKGVLALANGPMKRAELAVAMEVDMRYVDCNMSAGVANDIVIRLRDKGGVLYYALADKPVDESFTVLERNGRMTDAPTVRTVVNPTVKPTAEAIAIANLFRRGEPIAV
jgi:hypothetical protein